MSFYDRIKRSQIATNDLKAFLGENVDVQGFGIESIGNADDPLRRHLKVLENNYNNPTAMLLEYFPDYIVYTGEKVFFLESKVSITPCWSERRINDANNRVENTIDASNCGEIAREPFLAYRKYFPDTVILYVNNYNSNAVLAQYAKNIQCLRCEGNGRDQYDCSACPLVTGGFYESAERNNNSGSGTPSTNINLDSFVPARDFFRDEFNITISETEIQAMENAVLSEGLGFGNTISLEHKKRMIGQIWNAGNHKIKCLLCGGDLVKRTNSQTNQNFIGCSNYTNGCRFSVSL